MVRLVLASTSPRRLELLRLAWFEPLVVVAGVDEQPDPASTPEQNAVRLARDKAREVARRHPDDVVLGADTVVVVDGVLLGKPEDREDAGRMLRLLAGRSHAVVTCVHLVAGDAEQSIATTTEVVFRDLDAATVSRYLDSGEWQGKAGGYAIQGRAAAFVRTVRGSYTNVVGLPLCEVAERLRALGVEPAGPDDGGPPTGARP